MSNTILELRNVSKIYKMGSVEVPALRNISMSIKKGEFLAIVGASGSGKSTILNLIGCLDVPTEGNIFLEGQNISELSESDLAKIRGKKIGFIFQMFNLYPTLNVSENIKLPMRIHEFDANEIEKQTLKLIKLVGLEHRVNHLPSQLSGGEKQRVAIARALSTNPSMILADEPTGNVDSKVEKEIMEFLVKLHKKEKRTIVVVTHDANVTDYAERVTHLKDGEIINDEKNLGRGD